MTPPASSVAVVPQPWWRLVLRLERGDVDATVSQVGFNLAQLVIPVFLLVPFGISAEFSVPRFLPGFALGLLVASLGLARLALNLARREGRDTVTAHAYGNNVPAIIAYTLGIMAPVYLETHDANRAWAMGAAAVTWTGIIKLAALPFVKSLRKLIPAPAAMTVFGAAIYSYLALVLLQRLFDNAVVGLVGMAIVAASSLSNIPITRWRIPPFLAAWLVPLIVALAIGYVHPSWRGMAFTWPFARPPEALHSMVAVLPYLSVIAPISVYHLLQDIASVAGGASVGDEYDVRSVLLWDGLGTLTCGLAGSVIAPELYALLPPYKGLGARIAYAFWTPIVFLAVVMTGLTMFTAQLFPWPILAAMICYSSIGVGMATLRKVEPKYWSAVLLGFVLPAGAVVQAAMTSALPALKLSAANPVVQAALDRSIYWSSLQGLGNGFLFLVLVVASLITEMIDRRFARAALWCVIAAVFSWFGLMHSATMHWAAQPQYAEGWLAAAVIVFSAQWWRGDAPAR
jgi:AGZA family xanthine/uracil permease-like MFS transporter